MFGEPPVVASESRASVSTSPRRNRRRSAATVGSTEYDATRAFAVASGVEVTQLSPHVARIASAPLSTPLPAQSPQPKSGAPRRELRSLGVPAELEDEAAQETTWLGQTRSPLAPPELPVPPASDLVATKLETSDGEERPALGTIPIPALGQDNDPFAETRVAVATLSQKLLDDVRNLVVRYTREVNALMQLPAVRLPAVHARLPSPIASDIAPVPERVPALPELMFPHVAASALDEDTGAIFTHLRGIHFSGSSAGRMLGRTAVDVKKWFTAYHQPLTTAGMWTFISLANGCSIEKHPVPTDPGALVVFENALYKLGMSKESYEDTLIPSEPRKYKARRSRTGDLLTPTSQAS